MLSDSFCGRKVCADRAQATLKAVDAAEDDGTGLGDALSAVQNYDAVLGSGSRA